jgi:hypothetical protein
MSFEGLFVISVPELAAAIYECTPIHDSTPGVHTSEPCLDFVWGDQVVPFRDLSRFDPAGRLEFGAMRSGCERSSRPALGRARVPGVLPCIVFPPPVRDPALDAAPLA